VTHSQLHVGLGRRSYPIHIGHGLLARQPLYAPARATARFLVVSDENVAPLYLEAVLQALRGLDAEAGSLILPAGESHKTLATFEHIITQLLAGAYDRDTVLVALGGGVIGDLTGFAAACYQRGVACVQVPTTLLAQVDSSVGGKTGVNHALGKNMIGAFHQPAAVIADVETLATLPPREFAAGLAEVIKYGLIRDAELFQWLEANMQHLWRHDADALVFAIERSCRNKAAVVEQDEREQGARALLNLGHTFGHAMETAVGYRGLLHGEAVAVGQLMAAELSCRQGWLERVEVDRIAALLQAARLPLLPPAGVSAGRLRELMMLDKKTRAGHLRLVLLSAIGRAEVRSDFDEALLLETLESFCGKAAAAG